MAWSFGDSFDLYAAAADMINGYWDSGSGLSKLGLDRWSIYRQSGDKFRAPPCLWWSKAAASTTPCIILVVSFRQTAAISGTTLGFYLELFDGATAQCSIVFRSDGAILLTSGGPAGTVLATYTGAFPVINTWYAFEFEVVINNTTGSFAVRKNGNTVNDFTLGCTQHAWRHGEQLRQQNSGQYAVGGQRPAVRRPLLAERRGDRDVAGRHPLLRADARERPERDVLEVADKQYADAGHSVHDCRRRGRHGTIYDIRGRLRRHNRCGDGFAGNRLHWQSQNDYLCRR